MPLVEIVSRPDMRTAEQARAYVGELRPILVATGVVRRPDGRGVDAGRRQRVGPTRRRATSCGTRCEIKNLNSLRSLGRAIEHEARRQIDLVDAGEAIRQETRHWDEDAGRTSTVRSKEEAEDYRYFPEPDLVPLEPDAGLDRPRSTPPCPRCRPTVGRPWPTAAAVTDADAALLVERGQDGLALEAIAAGADPARVLTRVENDLADDDQTPRRRRRWPSWSAWRPTVSSPPPRPSRCWPTWSRAAVGPADIAAERGFEAMDIG